MIGSEKQITWALEIRKTLLKSADTTIKTEWLRNEYVTFIMSIEDSQFFINEKHGIAGKVAAPREIKELAVKKFKEDFHSFSNMILEKNGVSFATLESMM